MCTVYPRLTVKATVIKVELALYVIGESAEGVVYTWIVR